MPKSLFEIQEILVAEVDLLTQIKAWQHQFGEVSIRILMAI
jgi:hypothetical protein